MRRIAAVLLVPALLILLCFSAAAEQVGLRAECEGELRENRLFHVDICCDQPLRSLQLHVEYDDAMVAFRSASCNRTNDAFRYTSQQSDATLVWAADSPSSGALFTLCFKSLTEGNSTIVIEPVEAVGENLAYMEDAAVTFDVSVGDRTVTLQERERTTSTVGKTTKTASKKDPTERSTIDEVTSSESLGGATVSEIDLSPKNSFPIWQVLGLVAFAAVFVVIGILIGRNSRKAKKEKKKQE